MEPEFAKVLRKADMNGSTLSAVIRESWDTGNLHNLTLKPIGATNAHIAIICHITKDELRRLLTTTEAANGFVNRFLWVWSERSQLLPFGGELSNKALAEIVDYIRKAKENLYDKQVDFGKAAHAEWNRVYGPISEGKPGLLGAATGRSDPQVCRLALLYAQLDGKLIIELPHLAAALEVWRYCEDSARYVFGELLGDDTADAILAFLRTVGAAGATRTDISNLFGRNKPSAEIQRALNVLAEAKLARVEVEKLEDNPASRERWYACCAY
jgi:hypothetical protein